MARKFPPEAYQLAETYQLGAPLKRRAGLGWIMLYSFPMIVFLLGAIGAAAAAFGSFASFGTNAMLPLVTSCTSLLCIAGIVIYLSLARNTWRHYAYECTNGFVEVNRKTREVRHVLHWDEVSSARVSGGGRSLPIYYVSDIHGKEFEVPYHAIWRRCKREARKRTAVESQKR